MKKALFFISLLLCTFTMRAQEIHELPGASSIINVESSFNLHVANGTVTDQLVVDNINNLLTTYLTPAYKDNLIANNKDVNVYYARRVKSHILLYHYFNNTGETTERDTHLAYFNEYFLLLLNKQCISYNTSIDCSSNSGGFSFIPYDNTSNPRTTALALEALLEARKFFKIACDAVLPISETEFEDRIQQATDALLTYPEYNNQYFNLTAFGFITASKHFDAYRDIASKEFLSVKGKELLYNLHPLRPNISTEWHYLDDWSDTYNWNEGYQVDGSWKDFGRDRSYTETASPTINPRAYNAYERWHDSEMDYHSIMIEGLAHLYRNLDNGSLKLEARTKLIAAINHIIDYNKQATGLENTIFDTAVVDLTGIPEAFSHSRLTGGGRIAKYHRETIASEYPPTQLPLKKTVVGVSLLRSLITARNTLKSFGISPGDLDLLDLIIYGITHGILEGGANVYPEQLYDLSMYLNRDAVNGNFPGTQYTNDKLIVSFENKVISAFHEDDDAPDNVVIVDNFYTDKQEAYNMASGDYNGNGVDEIAVSFEYGNIYRYEENIDGRFAITERIYNGGELTLALETGNFNDNNKDELIVALANGEIRRYEEDTSGNITLVDIFHSSSTTTMRTMKSIDFNGNGKDELIVAFDNNTIIRYKENALGNLEPVTNGITYKNAVVVALEAGDFDGNDTEELIIAYDNIIQRYKEVYSGTSYVGYYESFYTGSNVALNLESGDFDNDMKDELIIAFNDDTIWRYKENISGALIANINGPFYDHNQSVKAFAVGDFNNDNTEELVISFQYGLIYRYHENSAGNLQIKEGIYNCNNYTNAMVALEKDPTASRANAQQDVLFEKTTTTDTKVFPNPVSNILHISGLNSEENFSIYSLEGKLITNGIVQKNGEIDFSKLSKGFYILKVANNNIFKIIKK